jgi:MarC family membrane protein
MTIASAAFLLFLVMDPLGNVPFFLSALSRVEPPRRVWVVARELLVAYAVLVAFLFVGSPLLHLMHVSEPALTIAGGVVLFLIAVRMIFPAAGHAQEEMGEEPFIVPLAIPYVAGPSAMATVILVAGDKAIGRPGALAAVTLAWVVSAAIIAASSGLSRCLGRKGLVAIERLMGMVLVAVAVQMFLDGVQAAFSFAKKE